MELIRSNRTENLADALASRIRDQALGPFDKEVIVVQSRGMERWLTLALAERLGIWGNPSFPFPRAVIEEVLGSLSQGRSQEAKAYEPNRLKWTIAELLRETAPAELGAYLGEPPDADRTLRLATAVSRVFDGYVMYRPALLKRCANGTETGWQAELWQRVVERLGPHDLASRIDRALSALRAGEALERAPFKRLHLFSLETLPPMFLELFSVLSKTIPTAFYLLEPSCEYVSDVLSTPQLPADLDAPADGHQLLSTLGRLARDFQELLLTFDQAVHHEADLFEAPARDNLLGSLQADILEFRAPPEHGARETIDATDESVSLHACSGPMREAQVVHDLIRAALEDDASLRPEDIVVMTPDLEAYAPAFRAVFGQEDQRRIPYEVHDRKTRDDALFYDDFLAVLEVLDSRFSVLDLVRLMDANSLRQGFRFTPDERARLAELLSAAGVRWGIDSKHREELEFPAEALHTWRAGLGRLFLGFASASDSSEVFEGLLPRGAASLADAELLARLARLCELLFDFQTSSRQALEISGWVAVLERIASSLFSEDDESSAAARTLRSALAELGDLARGSGYAGAVSLKTVRRELGLLLVQKAPAVGFLRRGVTVTELVPLRSVPFRVVCLVGMSEDSFPRADDRPSFDLSRPVHERGDRNKRDDDRHSFLQAILCARDRLIVSYSTATSGARGGESASPVVWELRETLRRYYTLPGQEPVLEATVHPLHPFDARYFDGSDLPRSTSERYLKIAEALRDSPLEPERIELRAEPEPERAGATLSIGELSAWLWDPMGAFIERVLRARFGSSELYEPSTALTEIAGLGASKVGNEALRAGLHDEGLEAYLEAAPEFPDGSWGALARRRLAHELRALNAEESLLDGGQAASSALLSLDLGGLLLEGRLDGLFGDQRVLKRFSKAGKRGELGVWLEHLLMQTTAGLPKLTRLVLRGNETHAKLVSFGEVQDPRGTLEALVELYRRSLETPLPLLAESSRRFAEELAQSDLDRALKAAKEQLSRQRLWTPHLTYALGPEDPFADQAWCEDFQRAAIQLYEPLFEHRSEG